MQKVFQNMQKSTQKPQNPNAFRLRFYVFLEIFISL
jgi:hypothetical protein